MSVCLLRGSAVSGFTSSWEAKHRSPVFTHLNVSMLASLALFKRKDWLESVMRLHWDLFVIVCLSDYIKKFPSVFKLKQLNYWQSEFYCQNPKQAEVLSDQVTLTPSCLRETAVKNTHGLPGDRLLEKLADRQQKCCQSAGAKVTLCAKSNQRSAKSSL